MMDNRSGYWGAHPSSLLIFELLAIKVGESPERRG